MPVKRQDHEESLIQWSLEKESWSNSGIKLNKNAAKLLQIVDRMIDEYTLTYEEYVNDILEYISNNFNDAESKEDREAQVDKMYEHLMNKYTTNGESSEEQYREKE